MKEQYNFNISLSVLNHLGRNLYRNIITVLGEAISNSWDADAKNVRITIDREKGCMKILDDGLGMSGNDFQNKFLKIGYTKRKGSHFVSPSGRPYIGRKGIGKLALLSCAKRIHIITKTKQEDPVGGIIDNSGLDKAIQDDVSSQDYMLEEIDYQSKIYDDITTISSGTLLFFEDITNGIFNTVEYIKKAIALYFRFALIDSDFHIYVNEDEINETHLNEIANSTQFLWKINGIKDPYTDSMENLRECKFLDSRLPIKGYIASVQKPSQLKLRGTQEKVTIDLFVNGRLREKDILRHIPTARIVENYVYGQIHYDNLDVGDSKDIFTSSREGIISDDPNFAVFLSEFEQIFKQIMEEWDDLRRKYYNDGDPENMKISKRVRKAQELFNSSVQDMNEGKPLGNKGGKVEEWIQELAEDAQFNIPSYTDCFIAENLLRKYIQHTGIPSNQTVEEEAAKRSTTEHESKERANISFDIRRCHDPEFYLDMRYLANWIDKVDKSKEAGLNRSAIAYKPMRDAVGHTSLLTDLAKQRLSIEFENIKARVVTILQQFEENKS